MTALSEDNQQPLAWIGGSYLLQQLCDSFTITRFPPLQADEVTVVGGIGPKDVEAIPARVRLQLHGLTALNPALAGDGGMEQVCGIQKIDLATARQRPLFAV